VPASGWRTTAHALQGLTILALLSYWPALLPLILNACGIWLHPSFGPYAVAVTWVFMMAGFDFPAAVTNILRTQG
jgi:hypothetical protein